MGMNRRRFLYVGATAGTTGMSGCLFGIADRWGANPTLELRNHGDSAVQLEITVERETFREGGNEVTRTSVFDETVTVTAGETKTLEILGDDSFRITVRLGDRRLQFETLPTCDDAFTRVTVADDRSLSAKTRDCEGVTREFPRETPTAESGE